MKVSKFSEQQIALILKQVDDGFAVEEVCRKAGVSQQTYYRWRKKYGGKRPSKASQYYAASLWSSLGWMPSTFQGSSSATRLTG